MESVNTLTGHARKALIREATKRPMVTLGELQISTAQVGESVHRKTISHTIHKYCLYRRVVRKKSLSKESRNSHLKFAISHVRDASKHVKESTLVRLDQNSTF